jgi:hypothetical protein
MINFFKKIIRCITNLFSKRKDTVKVNRTGEDSNNIPKGNRIPTYEIDKQKNPIYLSLKKACTELNVRNLTGLIDFFNSCYRNRIYTDWYDKVINEPKDRKNDTIDGLKNIMFYKALRAFFGHNISCSVKLGYDYGSDVQEIEDGNDWELILDWTITKMAYKWLEFIACPTQSDAVKLIFTC